MVTKPTEQPRAGARPQEQIPVAEVTHGRLGNRLMWHTEDAQWNTPVGTLLYAAPVAAQPQKLFMRDPITTANMLIHEWNETPQDSDEWGNRAVEALNYLASELHKEIVARAAEPVAAQPQEAKYWVRKCPYRGFVVVDPNFKDCLVIGESQRLADIVVNLYNENAELVKRAAQAAPAVPDGHVIVPKELTDEMGEAWAAAEYTFTYQGEDHPGLLYQRRHQYRAMLDAAPSAPAQEKNNG